MRGGVLVELLHLIGSVAAIAALFWVLAWSYPQGRHAIWPIGWVTMATAAGMSLPAVLRARRRSE